MADYWGERYDMMYYSYVRYFVRVIGAKAASLIDIGGGNGAAYVTWFPWIPSITSLDVRSPYVGPGITSVKADFHSWQPNGKYDIALCLQVLEHLDKPAPFLRKMLEISRHAIVSVPFEWPKGASKWHVQDPVGLDKLQSWAGRAPNYHQIITEPFQDGLSRCSRRLIAYYDVENRSRKVSRQQLNERWAPNNSEETAGPLQEVTSLPSA